MTKVILFIFAFFAQFAFAGDAVIFSGNDVKALKYNLDLFGRSKILGLNLDPSAGGGVQAPLASLGLDYLTGLVWVKTGGGATDWEQLVPGGGGGGGTGTPNTFAGFDPGGNLYTLPNWTFNPDNSGSSAERSFSAANPGGYEFRRVHQRISYLEPSDNLTNVSYTQFFNDFNFDDPNTGNNLDQLVVAQNSGRHNGDGNIRSLTVQANYFTLGNGTSTGTTQDLTGYNAQYQVQSGYQVTNYLTDMLTQTVVRPGAVVGGHTSLNANPQYEGTVTNTVQGITYNPNISSTGSVPSITGFITNPSINSSIGDLVGFGSYAYGTASPSTYRGLDVGSNFDTLLPSMNAVNVYTNNDVTDFTGYSVGIGSPYNIQNFLGVNIYTQSVGNNFTGVLVNGQGTYNNAIGMRLDMSQFITPNIPTALAITGRLDAFVSGNLPPSEPVFNVNQLVSNPIVAAGSPISGFMFGLNTSSLLQFNDDFIDTTSGVNLGFTSVAFAGQLAGVPGKTLSAANGSIAGFAIPPDSTGGTVTELTAYRAIGVLPSGGTINIDRTYGFKSENFLCTFAALCFGMYLSDTTQNNWVAGSSVFGDTAWSAARATIDNRGSYSGAAITITTDLVLDASHQFVVVDAAANNVDVTIPACDPNTTLGRVYTVKRLDNSGFSVNLISTSGDNFDGAPSLSLPTQYSSYSIFCGESGYWGIYAARP